MNALALELFALAVSTGNVEPPPSPRCRTWGPERAACVQVTPDALSASLVDRAPIRIRVDDLEDGRFVRLPVAWLGTRADRPKNAAPGLEPRLGGRDGWAWRPTRLYRDDVEAGAAILWFRLELALDPELVGVPLALAVPGTGAAEVYVDGELVRRIGQVGPPSSPVQDGYGRPFVVRFSGSGRHVLAVRWAAKEVLGERRVGYTPAFRAMLGHPEDLFGYARRFEQERVAMTALVAAFPLGLAILHLCLLFFRRSRRGDLVFASVALSVAGTTALPLTFELVWPWDELVHAWTSFRIAAGALGGSMVLFHLHLLGQSWPSVRWGAIGTSAFVMILAPVLPNRVVFGWAVGMVAVAGCLLARALGRASGRIHALGVLGFLAGATVTLLGALDVVTVGPVWIDAHAFGVAPLLTGMAIALAWEVGEVHRERDRQHREVARLSSERLSQERRLRAEEVARVRLESERQEQARALETARSRERLLEELETAYAELRRAQVQLVESKRLASVAQLAAGLAHELNSPLGALRSSLDVAARCARRLGDALAEARADEGSRRSTQKLTRAHREALATGTDAVERIAGIMERLEGFVGLDEAEVRDVDLQAGLENALAWVDRGPGGAIAIERRFHPVPLVRARAHSIHRVLVDLLENAVAAIRAGGGRGTIEVRTERVGDEAWAEIADDGIGMSEDEVERLFEVGFRQGARVEMSLGLLVAHRVVTAHGGRLDVESRPGVGTRVRVALPIDPRAQVSLPDADPDGKPRPAGYSARPTPTISDARSGPALPSDSPRRAAEG